MTSAMTSESTSTSVCLPPTSSIPLHRLAARNAEITGPSSTQPTSTTTLPDWNSADDNLSITTTATDASLFPDSSTIRNFKPSSTLQIQAEGKNVISSPLPPKQLKIPIFASDGESQSPKYLSIKAKRRSGTCVLLQVGREGQNDTQVASTTYIIGPRRYPIVRIAKESRVVEERHSDFVTGNDRPEDVDEFKMQPKRMVSRTTYFRSEKWGRFEWRYAGHRERALADPSDKKSFDSLLVLEKVTGTEDTERRIKVGQLIKNDDTRTPGTRRTTAGNGGRLELCLDGGGEDGLLVDEATVVATCLVMLKKEIDRMRRHRMQPWSRVAFLTKELSRPIRRRGAGWF